MDLLSLMVSRGVAAGGDADRATGRRPVWMLGTGFGYLVADHRGEQAAELVTPRRGSGSEALVFANGSAIGLTSGTEVSGTVTR